jgi:hypothetical protein
MAETGIQAPMLTAAFPTQFAQLTLRGWPIMGGPGVDTVAAGTAGQRQPNSSLARKELVQSSGVQHCAGVGDILGMRPGLTQTNLGCGTVGFFWRWDLDAGMILRERNV